MTSDVKLVLGLITFYVFYIVIANDVFSADNSAVSVATSRGATTNYDEITVGTTSCRQAMISATQLEFGIGSAGSQASKTIQAEAQESADAVVFARITYQLGMPKRMDCSKIYELELIKLREELRRIQQQ